MNKPSALPPPLPREPMPPGAPREYMVWDLPTRLFHWGVVILVAIAWATSEGQGVLFTLHSLAGYGVLTALLFRVAWGFVGGTHARFPDFVRSWPEVKIYLGQLVTLQPPRFVGHNPPGGWMVILLLIFLALTAATGLFSAGDEMQGPLVHKLSDRLADAAKEVHEAMFDVLITLVAVHVAAVIADQILTGDKLVRAMFSGRKQAHAGEAGVDARPGNTLAALALFLLAAGIVWLMVA